MKVFVSRDHELHRPEVELWAGVRKPAVEVPERAEAIELALREDPRFVLEGPREHGTEPLEAVHEAGLIRFLEEAWGLWEADGTAGQAMPDAIPHPAYREGMGPAPEPGSVRGRLGFWTFETMTPIGPGTYRAARAAADLALEAAEAVMEGERAAYALCRPPGHHAARALFGGYCYLNNSAIAAEHLVRGTGEKVAILDLDYHHGNGTQQIFYRRPDVLYVSLHADPMRAYPHFSGHPDETGAGPGAGATMNIPLKRGCEDGAYLGALDRALDRVEGFGAGITVVSLGLDTYREDPICDLALSTDVYLEMGRRVAAVGRSLVVVQEGGYHLPTLGHNVRMWLTGAADPS